MGRRGKSVSRHGCLEIEHFPEAFPPRLKHLQLLGASHFLGLQSGTDPALLARQRQRAIWRSGLKPRWVSQRCVLPPSRYHPCFGCCQGYLLSCSISTKEILLGTVSVGEGRVFFFPGYPLAISRFVWLPGSSRQLPHCPGPVECVGMLLAAASIPPTPGWPLCFHTCLGMSSLGRRGRCWLSGSSTCPGGEGAPPVWA